MNIKRVHTVIVGVYMNIIRLPMIIVRVHKSIIILHMSIIRVQMSIVRVQKSIIMLHMSIIRVQGRSRPSQLHTESSLTGATHNLYRCRPLAACLKY
jgi:hypothetical protein